MNQLTIFSLMIAATVMVLFWVFLFLKYRNEYDDDMPYIDSKQFLMPELYFIGFGVIDLFRINLRTERGRRKEKRIAEVYGERNAGFYHRCILGGQITYALTFIPIGLLLGMIRNSPKFAFFIIAAVVAVVVVLDINVNNAVEKKRDEVLSDLPEVLSKLALLVNAGMVIRDAWARVAYSSDRALYREMQITTEEMKDGQGILDALYDFSQRCGVKEIRKFASILSQNIQKGGSELTISLRYMSQESWDEKKHRAIQKGEKASSKLLMPLMIMFVGVLFMVMVPILSNILS